jgi:Zn finger protein HypA/HybF involved in hydrogenase expression
MDRLNNKEALVLLEAQGEFIEKGETDISCPRCGSHLLHEEGDSWEITRCEISNCISVTSKGV